MIIRRCRSEDIAHVQHIETLSLENPWSVRLFQEELQSSGSRLWVAEIDGQIQGFACFRICAPECELLRLAVAPSARRAGIGRALLDHACRCLTGDKCVTCFLEVRASNNAARALYEHAGFIHDGRRARYYNNPVEDAMLYSLNMVTPQGVLH